MIRSFNGKTPILVGIAQVEQREDDLQAAKEPLDLMLEAVGQAGIDCGNPAILQAADSVRVIRGMWAYANPARIVAEQIGVPNAQTGLTSLGGNYVQNVTNRSVLDIQAGRHDIIVVTGAECGRTQARATKAKIKLDWAPVWTPPGGTPQGAKPPSDPPELFIGSHKVTRHEAELKRGIERPIQFYPMFEIALRYANRETIDEHLERISTLWEGFSQVAGDNPHGWIRTPMSAEEIRTPSPANRPVSFPYTKFMNSNNSVDQGAALILTSVGTARRLGIPETRWVYPQAGTEAWDHLYVSERDNLYTSPAIRLAGKRVLELSGIKADDLDFIDLYSCFPAAVQVAAREIGIPFDRRLTVTGGLTFAGGPQGNYVMHAIARMAELLRDNPGSRGLVTANGGLLTKHALCVYSSQPPEAPFQWADLQTEADDMPKRRVRVDHDGEATIESYVVMYGPDGPNVAHTACLLADGSRTWANICDREVIEAMLKEEFCGRKGRIDGAGTITLKG